MVIKSLRRQIEHDLRKPIPDDIVPEKIYISFSELRRVKNFSEKIRYFESLLPIGGNLIIVK